MKLLHKINNINEMIDFIISVENEFGCPEYFESFFEFERNWDEDTGEILETVKEYYDKGGKFNNIPNEFPVVISYVHTNEYDDKDYCDFINRLNFYEWISV